MAEIFLKIVNMSLSASWLVLAVLILRLLLKKAPKWVSVLLWGIVAVRLLCPFTIESAMSLIPSAEVISPEIMTDRTPEITTGIHALNSVVNPIISESLAPAAADSANPLQIWIPILSVIWLLGMAVMVLYVVISYVRLRRSVSSASWMWKNVYQSGRIPSPFVLGIVKPRIYLPYGMDEADMAHVIAHEQTHIRRKDHWWKPLGFLLLTVHWFNPLMWVGYVLLCRDIELACDEKVIRELGRDQRADYSQALLSCSVNRKMISACPLAFGEVGVKERVRNVLRYKQPAFWIIVIAVILCMAVAVCFLTDPQDSREFPMEGSNVADLDPRRITDRIAEIEDLEDDSLLCVNADNFSLNLTSDFEWADSGAVRFFYYRNQREYSAQLRLFVEDDQFYVTESTAWTQQDRIFKLYHYLQALKYLPQDQIRQMTPDADRYIVRQVDGGTPDDYGRVLTYTPEGAGAIYGWLIHLELLPMYAWDGAYTGQGEEAIHLFFGDERAESAGAVTRWIDNTGGDLENAVSESETRLEAFPGVTFRYNYGEITAADEKGETVLISGMPVWDAYITDLTGDGDPEICATVSFGSGLVDTHVVVYDYANQQEYTLWDRGNYNYSLRLENGTLLCDKFSYAGGGPVDKGNLLASGELILADAGGGDGRRLVISDPNEKSGATLWITDITDRTVTEQLDTADAEEVFYEDAEHEYSFGSIKSHYVMVTYSNGNSEDIKTALSAGRAAISDLDFFGIRYFVNPKQSYTVMRPTEANLEGLHAGYIFVPIDGATYRYQWSESEPDHVTADQLLATYTEETASDGVVWEVYSLKEYPDKTRLLLISGTRAAWLCDYSPAKRADENAFRDACDAGYVIVENTVLTHSLDAWQAFCAAAQAGEAASVKVAQYMTLDPDRTASATYAAYQEDYPMLYISELSYNGSHYTLSWEENGTQYVRTYEYLMSYEDHTPQGACTEYVLTHDNTVSWETLWRSAASSVAGAYIDHHPICAVYE